VALLPTNLGAFCNFSEKSKEDAFCYERLKIATSKTNFFPALHEKTT
jgi:hypothetical protein